jgi:hypothetical protein
MTPWNKREMEPFKLEERVVNHIPKEVICLKRMSSEGP